MQLTKILVPAFAVWVVVVIPSGFITTTNAFHFGDKCYGPHIESARIVADYEEQTLYQYTETSQTLRGAARTLVCPAGTFFLMTRRAMEEHKATMHQRAEEKRALRLAMQNLLQNRGENK